METIYITKNGIKSIGKEKGIYIGRPSSFGNPYITKKSKYGNKIITLKDSLELYEDLLINNKVELKYLVDYLQRFGKLQLDCFCINRTVTKDSDFENPICHGELLAKYIFKKI